MDYIATTGVITEVGVPIAVGVFLFKELVTGLKALKNGKEKQSNLAPMWFVKFQAESNAFQKREIDLLEDIRDELKRK